MIPLVRIGSACVLLLISTLYLLASIPFSYYQFLQFAHFWWQPLFMRWHPLLLIVAVGLLLLTTRRRHAVAHARLRGLAIATVTVAACMAVMQWTPALQSFELSGALVFAPLALLTVANLEDVLAHSDRWIHTLAVRRDSGRTVAAAALAGVAASTVYIASAAWIDRVAGTLEPAEIATAMALSMALHVALFTLIALVLTGTRRIARKLRSSPVGEFVAVSAVAAALIAIAVRRVMLIAVDFAEWRAWMVAFALGVAVMSTWIAVSIQRGATDSRVIRVVGGIAGVALAVLVLPPMLRLADWDATLQKSIVVVTWLMLVGVMSTMAADRRRFYAIASVLVAIALSAATAGVAMTPSRPPASQTADRRGLDVKLSLVRYATFDMSMRVLIDLARPTLTSRQFLFALRGVGEVTENPATKAVPLPTVDPPHVGPAVRPDIFFIVIDSLRPDYLSAYNDAVTFTPAIGAFARDSIVMKRAFTPYSGTGLSEPALWTGGLVPRLFYPKPFGPINSLERLLVSRRYRRYISIDEVLDQILEDRTGLVPLDSHLTHLEQIEEQFKFDLCRTLPELLGRLETERPRDPVFVYTQPKNLHIRLIGGHTPQFWTLREQTEFFAPAVTVIRQLDGCFGAFIDRLKAAGRYDDSIIVLTADHGDAYGDEGRWGHAFYVSPEILRIPLIIHVPEALRRDRHWNTDAVAWSTDITPTLHELLGAARMDGGALAGRPLLTRAGETFEPRGDHHLVQSSYSRIFGVIDADANWLFTADANRLREDFFDLRKPGSASQPLVDADRLRLEKWLLEELGRLNAHYVPVQ